MPKKELSFDQLKIYIENPKGTYKSFEIENDPIWKDYPLTGVTYPVDYGYIDGYEGEDGAELDVFVGSGNLNGYIKVWRADVPAETKFFRDLTQRELDEVLKVFKPVLLAHQVIKDNDLLVTQIEKFKVKN